MDKASRGRVCLRAPRRWGGVAAALAAAALAGTPAPAAAQSPYAAPPGPATYPCGTYVGGWDSYPCGRYQPAPMTYPGPGYYRGPAPSGAAAPAAPAYRAPAYPAPASVAPRYAAPTPVAPAPAGPAPAAPAYPAPAGAPGPVPLPPAAGAVSRAEPAPLPAGDEGAAEGAVEDAAFGFIASARLGFFIHDAGIFGRQEEDSEDVNLEVLFVSPDFLDLLWSPMPHFGLTINDAGDTSQAYAGVTWEWWFWRNFFYDFAFGLSVHNGETETTALDAKELGSRVLFREAMELGWNFYGRNSVTFFLDHISHGGLFADKNEGLDNIGVRYAYHF